MNTENNNHPIAALKKQRPPRVYTLEQYLRLEASSTNKHEFLNGKIQKMPYARGPHNEISANIIALIKQAVKKEKTKFRVFSSDQKIYLPELNEGLYADILVISEKPEYFDDNQLLLTNPLVIVEVLSKSTTRYDRGSKFSKYKTLPSFKEYVLVEQEKPSIETWFREAPGLWRETIVSDLKETVWLESIGAGIALEEVYENIGFEL